MSHAGSDSWCDTRGGREEDCFDMPKLPITVSVEVPLIDALDRWAQSLKMTRSGAIELLLLKLDGELRAERVALLGNQLATAAMASAGQRHEAPIERRELKV